jgi:hypothetical protein
LKDEQDIDYVQIETNPGCFDALVICRHATDQKRRVTCKVKNQIQAVMKLTSCSHNNLKRLLLA